MKRTEATRTAERRSLVFLDKGRRLCPCFPGMNCRSWKLMSRFRVFNTRCAGFQSSALVASSPNHFSCFGCEHGERFIAFSDELGCVVGIRRIARQVVDNLRVRAKRSVLRRRRSQTRRRRPGRESTARRVQRAKAVSALQAGRRRSSPVRSNEKPRENGGLSLPAGSVGRPGPPDFERRARELGFFGWC
jgi:hypothetical protein